MRDNPTQKVLDVAIIGGGIAGLACAYRLRQLAKTKHKSLTLTVLEASERFGGTIQSRRHEDCLLEMGPDAMLSSKPAGMDLVRELGLSGSIIQTNAKYRRSFVASGNRLKMIPEGFYMIAPSKLRSFITSDILSLSGKVRAFREIWVPPMQDSDESVEQFITRRLGSEVFQKIGQPMVGGIYTGDPARLSMRHAVPRLKQLEQEHGSIIKGLIKERFQNKGTSKASGPRYSLFVSLQNGMSQLIESLCQQIGEDSLRSSNQITSLRRDATSNCWEIGIQNHDAIQARAIYLALPAYQTAKILPTEMTVISEKMREFEYESVALGHFIFKRKQIQNPLNGFGFVVPAVEHRTTIAVSYSSVKFTGRAPQDKVVIRAFVGGAYGRKNVELPNEILSDRVLSELKSWLGIQGEPLYIDWQKHLNSMPQYTIGHAKRVKDLKVLCASMNGFYLGGSTYEGVGIPDCVAAADKHAGQIMQYLLD